MKNFRLPSYIAIGVFITCMAALFIPEAGQMNKIIFLTTLGYGLVCIVFLGFQLWAFMKAHAEYDEKTEDIKYRVFEAEGIPLNEVETDY